MTEVVTAINTHILTPARLGLKFNWLVWTKYFDAAWAKTPLDEKLIWIMFLSHTLSILTIIQFLAFR